MKKLIIVLLTLLFTTVSYAETITIINSGKAGGSFNARTQIYKDGLIAKGYDINFENIGKLSQAVKMFKETDKPTIMIYSNNVVYKQDLFHTKENFIILEYQQPLFFCQTNASKNKTDGLTVAHGKGYDTTMLTNVFAKLSKQVTLVPYKNSGAMLKGILGGDVDMMFNNQGKSLKFIKSGKGYCWGNTGTSETIGVPSVYDAYNIDSQLPLMQATVIGTNIDVKTIREVIVEISNEDALTEYHTSRALYRPSGTWDEELKLVQSMEGLWAN